MAAGKWIGGFIGWMAGGPLGALAGYLVGSLFDSMLDGVNSPDNSGTWGSGSQRDYSQQRSYQDFNEAYQRAYRQRQQQGQRNSFLFSLLVLSSYIIKADGKAMHSEMELVRQMLLSACGRTWCSKTRSSRISRAGLCSCILTACRRQRMLSSCSLAMTVSSTSLPASPIREPSRWWNACRRVSGSMWAMPRRATTSRCSASCAVKTKYFNCQCKL